MLDRGLCVGDGVENAIHIEITVVLTELAGGDGDAKAALHLVFDLCDAIFVALLRISVEKGCVVFERVMCLGVCPV